jgi:hypothetical protein
LVAFFLALALGFLVLARTAGISFGVLRPRGAGRASTLRSAAPPPARRSAVAKGRSSGVDLDFRGQPRR